jgi:hypothetical protein
MNVSCITNGKTSLLELTFPEILFVCLFIVVIPKIKESYFSFLTLILDKYNINFSFI